MHQKELCVLQFIVKYILFPLGSVHTDIHYVFIDNCTWLIVPQTLTEGVLSSFFIN